MPDPAAPEAPKIPVTVLTGYLGAGKTTLLNRILSENHGRKFAVVINEFGELGVDNDLVIDAEEEIFEMNNGCICCTVRGDLIRILSTLMKRKGKFDGIIVETTGLANPAPVAQTFFVDEDVKRATALDAIVTVVDAKYISDRLADSDEAKAQVAFADVLLLNKTDLVSPAELDAAEAKIHAINPTARIIRTEKSAAPLDAVLDRKAFSLDRILTEVDQKFLESDEHTHNEEVRSVALTMDKPVDPEKFNLWMNTLLQTEGQDMLRTKGILHYANESRPFAFQAVHMIADGDFLPPRKNDDGTSRIVFIGRNLNRPRLRRGFEGCAAA
jgi:G3E family GTPase